MGDGGTVADAAVAAGFVLAVVNPHAATLGGDAFVLVRDGATGQVHGVNGSGAAPAGVDPAMFPEGMPRAGPQVSTVPGFVAAMGEMHERFGRLPWAELLAPATALAHDGFEVNAYLAANAERCAALLAPNMRAAELFLPGDTPLAAGDRLVQPDLARTLEAVGADGAQAFYRGALAERLAAGIADTGGLVTAADLAAHRTLWQDPVSAPFCGREVVTMPPNSYGLTMLLQLLLLERVGVADMEPDGPEFVLAGLAARRRAYAAAADAICDPVDGEAAAWRLLDRAIDGDLADGPTPAEAEGGTTNICIADRNGNAVSLVASVSAPFGNCVIAGDTGVLMNNRLRGFSLDAASPNRLAPGRRPAHTLTPAMVLRDATPEWIIGSPGTAGQTCVMAQLIARLVACNLAPAQALAAPRWSVDLQGKPIVETSLDNNVFDAISAKEAELRRMPVGWQTFGSAKACHYGPNGLTAYADRRRAADVGALDRTLDRAPGP